MATPGLLKKLLSIDGGGVRGVSALFILKQIMNQANHERNQQGLPDQEPWQMFDMIGGTSTGGLIAIMLGRLKMSLDECIATYFDLSHEIFPKHAQLKQIAKLQRLGPIDPKYDVKPFERILKEIIQKQVGDAEALLWDPNPKQDCKVVVFATVLETSDLALLRSYRNIPRPERGLKVMKIWEACRATSAAVSFLKSIVVDGCTYMDGGLQANNPADLIKNEASQMFPDSPHLLISLGTGSLTDDEFRANNTFNFFNGVITSSTNSSRAADAMARRDGGKDFKEGSFFRFDPPGVGKYKLDDTASLHTIRLRTEGFLDEMQSEISVGNAGKKLAQCHLTIMESLSDAILENLKPRIRNSKIDTLLDAAPQTCEWIWLPKQGGGPGLLEWLCDTEHTDESWWYMYWISGKPGAGKSTLMKYIHNNISTKLSATCSDPPCTGFFFFHSGKEYEFEILDFLNSLVYKLCVAYPKLTPHIYDLFEDRRTSTSSAYVWSETTLKKALQSISHQNFIRGTYLLFVDGLDECKTSPRLVDLMKEVVESCSSGSIKLRICAASRPEQEIEIRLGKGPRFTLEDYTPHGIYICVTKELEEAAARSRRFEINELHAILWANKDSEAMVIGNSSHDLHTLVGIRDEIVQKSQGVFMSATLIAEGISRSLDTGVPLHIMYKMLDGISEGLRKLWHSIFSTICSESHYVIKYGNAEQESKKESALKILNLLLDNERPEDLTTLELGLISLGLEKPNFCGRYFPLSSEERHQVLVSTEARIRNICKNLVEFPNLTNARNWQTFSPTEEFLDGNQGVRFTHLSVKDYLEDEVWGKETASMHTKRRIERCISRMNIVLRLYETDDSWWPPSAKISKDYADQLTIDLKHSKLSSFFRLAAEHEEVSGNPAIPYLHSLRNFLDSVQPTWSTAYVCQRLASDDPELISENYSDIYTIAAMEGLGLFLEHELKNGSPALSRDRHLLHFAVLAPRSFKVTQVLLQNGWDPNSHWEEANNATPWEYALNYAMDIDFAEDSVERFDTFRLFLEHGALPNQRVRMESGDRVQPFHVLFHLCNYNKFSWEKVQEMVKVFLERGVDPEDRDLYGRCALIRAAEYDPRAAALISENHNCLGFVQGQKQECQIQRQICGYVEY